MPRDERGAIMATVIHNSGYVVHSLEAALWAFGRSTSFEEGCLMVANLGDDSDTVAAIYGQVFENKILFFRLRKRECLCRFEPSTEPSKIKPGANEEPELVKI